MKAIVIKIVCLLFCISSLSFANDVEKDKSFSFWFSPFLYGKHTIEPRHKNEWKEGHYPDFRAFSLMYENPQESRFNYSLTYASYTNSYWNKQKLYLGNVNYRLHENYEKLNFYVGISLGYQNGYDENDTDSPLVIHDSKKSSSYGALQFKATYKFVATNFIITSGFVGAVVSLRLYSF